MRVPDPLTPAPASARRLALLGSRASFTCAVLGSLLARRVAPVVLLLHGSPAAGGPMPVETPHATDRLAYANNIAVHTVRCGARALQAIRHSGADVALVACYPRRLPVENGPLPRDGLFNLHPSPLPAFRGPTPLFWQFHAGVARTAVSLHAVAPGFDAGAVLARAWLALPPATTFAAASSRLADLGAGLAVKQLVQATRIADGEPQSQTDATYLRFPDDTALEVSPCWPAERLYRFVTGTAEWGRDYRLLCEGGEYRIERALGFRADGDQPVPVREQHGGRLSIRCTPGVLTAQGERLA